MATSINNIIKVNNFIILNSWFNGELKDQRSEFGGKNVYGIQLFHHYTINFKYLYF